MALNKHGTISVEELLRDPVAALDAYDPPAEQWKMSLHKDVIRQIQRDFSKPSDAVSDQTFLKDVHATLKAWYGKRAWIIVDFPTFKSEIESVASRLDRLSRFRIELFQGVCTRCFMNIPPLESLMQDSPTEECIGCVTSFLWNTIERLNLTTGKAKIVSGSKTLHHFLPGLLPPMDNRYTGEFFLGRALGTGAEKVFTDIYGGFVDLAHELVNHKEFMAQVGEGFNTSLTKTLDNAVIGFVTREDRATANAIAEGLKTPVVSKRQLFDALLK